MQVLPALHKALRRMLVARGVKSTVGEVGGYAVHFYEARAEGAGPPLVLVHGLAGSANGFYKVLLPLARRFSRVIAPDLPGNGFSPLASGQAPLNAERQYEVLVRFLREMVGEPSVIVGTSLGGAMCIRLAHEHPDLARALVLIAPAGARVAEERIAELLQSLTVTTNAQARALTRRLFHRTPVSALLLASDMRRMYGSDAVKAVLAEVKASDLLEPEVLRSLTMPTLLLWGESEKLLPRESVDFFRAHLPAHAELRVVPRFGHVPQMERPAELVQHIVQFAERTALIA